MPVLNGMLILDYPDLITVNQISAENLEAMRKHAEWLREFARKNNVSIQIGETVVTL